MHANAKSLFGWTAFSVLAVASLGAGASDRRLVEAAKNQDQATVRVLLKEKVDVNTPQGDGATALHWAVHWNDLDTIDLLIRGGARVDAANDYGVTPLSLACTNGSARAAVVLLAAGANPNAALTTGETALMRCAYSGSPDAVAALLANGANVNASEPSRGQTALMWAVAQRHPKVVRVLIERGADVHARSKAVPQLVGIGEGGNLDNPGGGSVDSGEDIGKSGMEIEEGGFTPLMFAAQQGDLDSTRLLLKAEANVNDTAADGNSVLVIASHSGHGKLAAFLLEQGADPNAPGAGYSALHSAVLRADMDLVKALLARGANPNAQLTKGTPVRRWTYHWIFTANLVGATPYLLAAKYAEPEIMRILASSGADPRAAMKDGTTALMAAVGRGLGYTTDRRGRNVAVEVVDAERANESRTIETLKVALELGGDINEAHPRDGNTALHTAAANGFKTVFQFLVDRGGDPNVKNKAAKDRAGKTPAELLRGPRANP